MEYIFQLLSDNGLIRCFLTVPPNACYYSVAKRCFKFIWLAHHRHRKCEGRQFQCFFSFRLILFRIRSSFFVAFFTKSYTCICYDQFEHSLKYKNPMKAVLIKQTLGRVWQKTCLQKYCVCFALQWIRRNCCDINLVGIGLFLYNNDSRLYNNRWKRAFAWLWRRFCLTLKKVLLDSEAYAGLSWGRFETSTTKDVWCMEGEKSHKSCATLGKCRMLLNFLAERANFCAWVNLLIKGKKIQHTLNERSTVTFEPWGSYNHIGSDRLKCYEME